MKTGRRDILRGSLAVAGLTIVFPAGIPEWALPALAQAETLVPFTDLPATINLTPTPDRRVNDIRKIDGPFTPKDQFFTTQHYGHPTVDLATFRLKITGLVDRPKSFSIDDLKRVGHEDLVAGFECSGNGRPLQGLCSNGRWTGVPLRTVLERQDAIKLAADSKEPGVADAMQLYIGAARLDEGRTPWRDRAAEADELRRAFDALDRLGVAIGDARDVELRIAALESLGRGSELVKVVERGVALPGLSPETQANWRAIQARTLIEQSAYDEAALALRALDATGVGNGRALDLWTSLAQRRLATGDPPGAAAILADVLARTPPETPAWCPRFLLSIEARLAADAPPRESLLAELRSAAARFAEGATAPEHATKYRELLGRCGGRP